MDLPLVEGDSKVPVTWLPTQLAYDESSGPDTARLEPSESQIMMLDFKPRYLNQLLHIFSFWSYYVFFKWKIVIIVTLV